MSADYDPALDQAIDLFECEVGLHFEVHTDYYIPGGDGKTCLAIEFGTANEGSADSLGDMLAAIFDLGVAVADDDTLDPNDFLRILKSARRYTAYPRGSIIYFPEAVTG